MKNPKRLLFSIALSLSILCAQGQKLKNKDVRKLVDAGKVSSISLLSPNRFIPAQNQTFDLSITFADGQSILASDYHFLWEEAVIQAINAEAHARGELLTKGNGKLVPQSLSAYYQVDSIVLSVEFAGKKSSVVLKTDYCVGTYSFVKEGRKGYSGTKGTSNYNGVGGSGSSGSDGTNGPDMSIQVDEEMISGKPYMIVIYEGEKLRLNPDCSSLTIITRGGPGGAGGDGGKGGDGQKKENQFTGNAYNGGHGGAGGSGGRGGSITVSGNAAIKYKSKLTLLSEGGKGGAGGDGGRGGQGKSNGRSGSAGQNGYDGRPGLVTSN